jgi:hypothetical protein
VLDLAGSANMAVDLHIVRWVRDDGGREFAIHQRCNVVPVARVAADDPVRSNLPNVPGLAPH